MRRNPFDGQPYYCNSCGLGFSEFIACEEVDCLLESEETAQARKKRHEAGEQEFK